MSTRRLWYEVRREEWKRRGWNDVRRQYGNGRRRDDVRRQCGKWKRRDDVRRQCGKWKQWGGLGRQQHEYGWQYDFGSGIIDFRRAAERAVERYCIEQKYRGRFQTRQKPVKKR